ncbi:hypothetical protein TCAL_05251 [Tigriopus californicus]|uniref:Uncharacterized protein n=1 Tax=Tigriopus californicus TaxID=6832 RepID=A0A553NR96_TIGCA|nr:hypothetical protein TCAL_05251 [Tigriopus californicus]
MRYLSKHFKHLRPMIPGGRGSLMDQKFEIRLRRVGCANRPSYSIDVFKVDGRACHLDSNGNVLGSYGCGHGTDNY